MNKKWEYMDVEGLADWASMNKFGEEGWELVSVVFVPHHGLVCFYKRPVEEKDHMYA